MKKLNTILFFLISIFWLHSQNIDFELKVNKKNLAENETFKAIFKIIIKNDSNIDVDKFIPPNFLKNFDIVGGPTKSTSSSITIVNGKQNASNTIHYVYIIKAKKKGKLTIGAASAKIGNKTYKSNALTVNVSDKVKIPDNPNSPERIMYDNIFISTKISNSNPYINEPIKVKYVIYFSININLPAIERPTFNNFWHKEVENKNQNSYYDYYKGKRYAAIDIYDGILIPQKSGKLRLEPYSINIEANIPTGNYNFWGEQITETFSQLIKSKSKIINVKQLPKLDNDEDFRNAVGKNFDINVFTDTTDLQTDAPFELKINISGNGNINLLNSPELSLSNDFEIYEPQYKQKTNISSKRGITGKISTTYIVIPRFRGKYTIPEIPLTYFDVVKRKYITKKSKPITVNVTGKAKTETKNNSDINDKISNKKDLNYIHKDILFIKTKTYFTLIDKKDFFGSLLFYIIILTPFIILLLYSLIKAISKNKSQKLESIHKKLSKLKKLINSNKKIDFYENMEKILIDYISIKIKVPKSNITKDIIKKKLIQKSIHQEQINDLLQILNLIDTARYSGLKSELDMQSDFKNINRIIKNLNKKL